MERLQVDLGARSYEIIIGPGASGRAGEFISPLLKNRRMFVVTDENVAKAHLAGLEQSLLGSGITPESIIMPPGEETKSFRRLEFLCEEIISRKPERGDTLAAFGGGVIGDLTGFAASIILRGLDFVQIPTTLLSQVDSSVGGKTGINTSRGKNLVGSFHQPRLVLIDVDFLSTLPRRELLSGYAEVVKYGIINKPDFFTWLAENAVDMLNGEKALLTSAIYQSCAAKAEIVGQDERESGLRALLNLGHTFGHALEAETGFSSALLHGEAVALGILMALRLSATMGFCPPEECERVKTHFETVGLPVSPRRYVKDWSPERLVSHMFQDKKVSGGKPVFILARKIGDSFIARDVPLETVAKLLDTIR